MAFSSASPTPSPSILPMGQHLPSPSPFPPLELTRFTSSTRSLHYHYHHPLAGYPTSTAPHITPSFASSPSALTMNPQSLWTSRDLWWGTPVVPWLHFSPPLLFPYLLPSPLFSPLDLISNILVVKAIKAILRRPCPIYNKNMTLVVSVNHWSFPNGRSSMVYFISLVFSICILVRISLDLELVRVWRLSIFSLGRRRRRSLGC